MSKKLWIPLLTLSLLSAGNNSGIETDYWPLYGIRTKSKGLKFKFLDAKSNTEGVLTGNEMPSGFPFEVRLKNITTKSKDSSNYYSITIKSEWIDASGRRSHSKLRKVKFIQTLDAKEDVVILDTMPVGFKANSNAKWLAVITTKEKDEYFNIEYNLKCIGAGKKLPAKLETFNYNDGRGAKSKSVTINLNEIVFKGLEGNKFLYKLKSTDPLAITLKGLSGFKASDGKIGSMVSLKITDETGLLLEEHTDITAKTMGEFYSTSKKAIEIKHKFTNPLESQKYYYAILIVKDRNNSKAVLEASVKFYLED